MEAYSAEAIFAIISPALSMSLTLILNPTVTAPPWPLLQLPPQAFHEAAVIREMAENDCAKIRKQVLTTYMSKQVLTTL